jgi:hypothetical protein
LTPFEWGLAVAAGLAAFAHGLVLIERPSSWRRTSVKALAVGALALLATLRGGPEPLVAALVLSAAADAAMEGESLGWLRAGLAIFAVADLIYAALFLIAGGGRGALIAQPPREACIALVIAFAAAIGAWVWDRAAPLRLEASVCALALALAAIAGLTLPSYLAPAMVGALCLAGSGVSHAIELARRGRTRLSGQVAWWLYVCGQGLIAAAFLQ